MHGAPRLIALQVTDQVPHGIREISQFRLLRLELLHAIFSERPQPRFVRGSNRIR